MSLLYQNLLRTYMSVAKDIFGNNQVQNPSVQDAMYEAVNTHKFSTSHFDDVPLARKYYEQLRQKKLRESRKNSFINNKTQSKTYQKPFKRDLCKYYLNGVCTKGDNCTYSHIIKDFPCKYYITLGNCDNKECR